MLREARCPEEGADDGSLAPRGMLAMAVATSIDALAVGITFAFLDVAVLPAVTFIGVITFGLSCLGVVVGSLFGTRFQAKGHHPDPPGGEDPAGAPGGAVSPVGKRNTPVPGFLERRGRGCFCAAVG